MAASPSTTPVSAVPTELLQHVLSFLPLEDRLHACCTSKAFEEACTGLALANVSLSMATLRRAHALQGRNWRPAKSLVVRWFHKHGEHIHSLTIRDVIKPFSDDDGPALLLPHCRMLTQLKLQVWEVVIRTMGDQGSEPHLSSHHLSSQTPPLAHSGARPRACHS